MEAEKINLGVSKDFKKINESKRFQAFFRTRRTLVEKLDQIVRDVDERQKAALIDTPSNILIFQSRNHLMNYILEEWVRNYEEVYGVINVPKKIEK